ncbi:hypothetical protein FOA52_007461 [Chlamydomonas sp. UWO 241]|nr:hypothetical protein FOA52_007461 [Chlamydomonas sp. UWO 241]
MTYNVILTIPELTEVLYAVLDFFTRWKGTCRIKDLWKAVEAMRVASASGGISYPGFKAYMAESERGVRASELGAKKDTTEKRERRMSGAVYKEVPATAAVAAATVEEIEVSTAILRYCAAQAVDPVGPRAHAQPLRAADPPGTKAFEIGALFRRFLPTGTAAVEQCDESLRVTSRSLSAPIGGFSRRRFDPFPDGGAPLECVDETAGDDLASTGEESPRSSESPPRNANRVDSLDAGHVDEAAPCPPMPCPPAEGMGEAEQLAEQLADRADIRGGLDAGRVHFGRPSTPEGGRRASSQRASQLLWGEDLDVLVGMHYEAQAGLRLEAHVAAEDARMANIPSVPRPASFISRSAAANSIIISAKQLQLHHVPAGGAVSAITPGGFASAAAFSAAFASSAAQRRRGSEGATVAASGSGTGSPRKASFTFGPSAAPPPGGATTTLHILQSTALGAHMYKSAAGMSAAAVAVGSGGDAGGAAARMAPRPPAHARGGTTADRASSFTTAVARSVSFTDGGRGMSRNSLV